MNPRYLNFCRVHGHTLEQQLKHDAAAWPGGRMCGFQLWISQQTQAFRVKHPEAFVGPHPLDPIYDQAAFDRWLDATTTKLEE